jgi:hypothetical protein
MYKTISVANLIECKGRNGLFNVRSVEVLNTELFTHIDFYSKVIGANPPSSFSGKKEDIVWMLEEILKCVKQ